MKHIVRIAPSPTGMLHIGTIRTAYFNWLIAQQNPESKFIVRIDDTDLNRSKASLIQPIFETLDDLGLDWDSAFKQSDRFKRYRDMAAYLVSMKYAKIEDGCVRLNKSRISFFSCAWRDEITGFKGQSTSLCIGKPLSTTEVDFCVLFCSWW